MQAFRHGDSQNSSIEIENECGLSIAFSIIQKLFALDATSVHAFAITSLHFRNITGLESDKSKEEIVADKPVRTFRHRSLQLAVWKNVSGDFTFYKSVLSCTYKDGDDYKSTSNIDYYDLPAASILFARAANWIAYQIEKESAGQRGD